MLWAEKAPLATRRVGTCASFPTSIPLSAARGNPTGREWGWTTIEEDYHWHIELMPRLIKVAGFEWGSGFYINPTPPEVAAETLRDIVL